ncbi:Ldh family oxidoreductase [Fimbriiglobus ruber]|uniref:Malate dehydrogenase n=1 Tax=Fimbriiglobus ruber TaxID=1908690 RepID=A0A225CZS0_9BACT|nr:Ldh family oxidoreductase [Fimbriiglobus ruber]OWK34850.1 malate dehydrogenase [Fimbriiglobus ruber]
MPSIPPDKLTAFASRLFEAAGVPAAEAATVAFSLVDANLCGHDSHGIMRVPQYVGFVRDGTYRPGAAFEVLNETPAVLAADGGWGLGQVQAHRLLSRLMPKAKALGVATGTLRRCGHSGRLGEYAETAAREGLAFFGVVNSHGAGRRVVPPGGTEGRISTNPICFGVPTPTDPIVLDFGTSVAAEGKVRVQHQKNEPTPDGWLVDHAGQPTTNPAVLYSEPRGGLLPFGGSQAYKGFGLGLVIDLLCGGLSGGQCSTPDVPMPGVGNALVFALFDPAAFGGSDHFLREASALAEYVRGCPPADPSRPVLLPGDPERMSRAARTKTGIPIADGTWSLIAKTAGELGVALPV